MHFWLFIVYVLVYSYALLYILCICCIIHVLLFVFDVLCGLVGIKGGFDRGLCVVYYIFPRILHIPYNI